ncbi:MAG: hypothetical protein WAU91_23085, partial [Desulfatitalea sp.]
TDARMIGELAALAQAAGGAMAVAALPESVSLQYHNPRTRATDISHRIFGRILTQGWRIASFSSMTAALPPEAGEAPDRDAVPRTAVAEAPALEGGDDLFAFPKGARAGIFFHDLLEHWDFQRKDAGYGDPLVAAKLEAHGFEARWQPAVARMLARLVHVGLPTQVESGSFCLAQVPSSRRVNEMEFYFPLKRVGGEKLKQYFKERGGAFFADTAGRALERLTFAPMQGFMKGYVDTIFEHAGRFYLLDWKSNHLGNNWDDYALPRLSAVMAEEYYFLQYHLYVVALDQLLRQRLPAYDYQRHFGGVYYLFLRGIQGPGAETGIYYTLPDGGWVTALRELLVEQ